MSSSSPMGNFTNLSELDRNILALLKQDARASFSSMAAQLDVSRTTVKDHIDRLKSSGVIQRFTIEVAENTVQPNNGVSAFFHIKLRRAVCKIIHESIRGWPELVGCWSLAGGTDMSIQISCVSDDHLEILRDRLARHPEIETLWTAIILRQWVQHLNPEQNYKPSDEKDRLDVRLEEIEAAEKYGKSPEAN